jgi:V8-like Glu-specific endopeptidase
MLGQTTRHSAIALALLALACALAGAVPARAAVETDRVAQSAAAVRDYWTPARLRAAEPAEMPIAPLATGGAGSERDVTAKPSFVPAAAPGAPARAALREGSPARPDGIPPLDPSAEEVPDPAASDVSAHGKVYFTVPTGDQAGNYVCSGTVVNSHNRSVVWTAGHCVFPEGGTEFVTNWIFIPGYRDGEQPYGQWPAKRLATTGPWQEAGNIKYDLGAAVVRRTAEGGRLQAAVGARGIGFDQPRDQLYRAFGYPAEPVPYPEFTGEREYFCESRPMGTDEPGTAGPPTMSISCDMTGGSSGGGWISGTTLLSVVSYGYSLQLDRLYGPYMSQGAKALYRNVRGKPKKKAGGKESGGKTSGGKGSKGGKGKR